MSTTDGGSANPYISIIMAIPETNTPATGRAVARGDHVYLIDASGYVFRAYHALPPLTRPSDGLPVGAVHGFCGMLWKLLRETGELDPPTHIAAIFDLSEHTFRNELYSDYKANRSEAPDDLIPQFPLIRDAVHAFNVACIEKRGYEADDLIATYAREAAEAGAEVTIVSSDKDLMQLVRPGVRMYDTMKNKVIGEAEVMERFGVPPSKVVEVQSLIGDSTDNVPGVPGIGVKTAALAHQRVRRSGDAARPRLGDQAGQAAREPHHFRRPGTAVEGAGDPRYACAARCRSRRDRRARARCRGAHRLHAQARIHHAAPPRGRGARRRTARRHDAVNHAAAEEEGRLRPPVAAQPARAGGAATAQDRGRHRRRSLRSSARDGSKPSPSTGPITRP